MTERKEHRYGAKVWYHAWSGLHLVALFVKVLPYDPKTLLDYAGRRGMEAAFCSLAFGGAAGWQNLLVPGSL